MYFVSSTHRCLPMYICTTFVFFVRITLVNLHSNQINCQGKARLKPSLPWAGIPCFSVYLLSRRGNSQVAAIPGSIHNSVGMQGGGRGLQRHVFNCSCEKSPCEIMPQNYGGALAPGTPLPTPLDIYRA